uniref:Pro-Pol polyprotein n=1 Tax=Cajanus cajan TaxID=3821 RepID=A0A151SC59_CAJCA|nr:Pro-Pol polyprotein [Cajanus cajan]
MPGIDPHFMCHKLSVCANARPIAQRKRKMGTDRKLAVEAEVAKLIEARFIREVQYTTWLENVVMVRKPNGKWRMCTDYTNLNKACPKDAYPLPNIDRLVDGASGHKFLIFLDAYSGYNQIRMHPSDELMAEEPPQTWITEMMDYLELGKEPSDPSAAKKLRTQAAREVHEGICGSHSGGRTLAMKVLRAGFFWPTLKSDCMQFVKRCLSCQRHGYLIHASAEELHNISSPWPFAMWGMDILGPFPIAKGQCKFLLVAVDYFTKWVEAKPLANITAANAQKFLWKNIITRLRIPYALVTDNGLQFTDKKLNRFIQDLGIKHRFTSVEHPQSNGQAEAANKVILLMLLITRDIKLIIIIYFNNLIYCDTINYVY